MLYLQARTNIFYGEELRLLHFAPEPALTKTFRAHRNINYVSTDLDLWFVSVRMDITDILFRDDTFDFILCSHVLEHVVDDRQAMRELYRVLKPGGVALVLVPIIQGLEYTLEDPSVSTSEERTRVFGQHDHVRRPGRDYHHRLEEAGFTVEIVDFAAVLGEDLSRRHALVPQGTRDLIFVCTKQPSESATIGPAAEPQAHAADVVADKSFRIQPHLIKGVPGDSLGARRGQMFAAILRELGPAAGRTLADLGCGSCVFARIASEQGYAVTAVDARTVRVPSDEDLADVMFVQSDVRDFDMSGFDVVTILGLLYHLDVDDQLDLLRRASHATVVVDTQFHDPSRIRQNQEAWERSIVERQGYRGVLYPEKHNPIGGWKNVHSFWPTEPSLLQMYQDAGFRGVTMIEPSYVSPYGARRFYVLNGPEVHDQEV